MITDFAHENLNGKRLTESSDFGDKGGLRTPIPGGVSLKMKKKIRDAARYQANKESMKAAARSWYIENKNEVLKRRAAYYAENRVEILACQSEYHGTTKGRDARRRENSKRLGTPKGRMHDRISGAIRSSIKPGVKKGRQWESLVGYDADTLMEHLVAKFTEGMTLEKFQKGLIHIDHKIPVSAFNFETPDDFDFKRCWALENLQPLWAKDNLRKSNKLEYPFQPSLLL